MNGTHLLRKLTPKSVMKFGINADLSVMELINLQKHKYLLWVYYHCAQIDFNEEVKEYLRITYDREIEKPGKSEDIKLIFKNTNEALTEIIDRDNNYKHLDFKARNFLWMEKRSELTRKSIAGKVRTVKGMSRIKNRDRNQGK